MTGQALKATEKEIVCKRTTKLWSDKFKDSETMVWFIIIDEMIEKVEYRFQEMNSRKMIQSMRFFSKEQKSYRESTCISFFVKDSLGIQNFKLTSNAIVVGRCWIRVLRTERMPNSSVKRPPKFQKAVPNSSVVWGNVQSLGFELFMVPRILPPSCSFGVPLRLGPYYPSSEHSKIHFSGLWWATGLKLCRIHVYI